MTIALVLGGGAPPVSNPSAQINQLNQSSPLNGGFGLNPTNRNSDIRYNLTGSGRGCFLQDRSLRCSLLAIAT